MHRFSPTENSIIENVTDSDADMRCCLVTKWRKALSVEETVASTCGRSFKSDPEPAVRIFEEDGHL